MVRLVSISNPFNEYYLKSFSCVKEEQNFKNALIYEKDEKGNILSNKKVEGFQYHEYSFITYLLKDENSSWLGYINLYNDIFVKKLLQTFANLAMPLLKEMAKTSEIANMYYKKLEKFECSPFDMDQTSQFIFSEYLQITRNQEKLEKFSLDYWKLFEEMPEELFIEFAIYDWLTVFPEDIDNLLRELDKILDKELFFSNCNIILKCQKNDIILGSHKYIKEETTDFCNFYLRNKQKNVNYSRRLIKPEIAE